MAHSCSVSDLLDYISPDQDSKGSDSQRKQRRAKVGIYFLLRWDLGTYWFMLTVLQQEVKIHILMLFCEPSISLAIIFSQLSFISAFICFGLVRFLSMDRKHKQFNSGTIVPTPTFKGYV